jgi:hypothetical protein
MYKKYCGKRNQQQKSSRGTNKNDPSNQPNKSISPQVALLTKKIPDSLALA